MIALLSIVVDFYSPYPQDYTRILTGNIMSNWGKNKSRRENRACSIHARFFYAAGQPCGTRRNSFLIWF